MATTCLTETPPLLRGRLEGNDIVFAGNNFESIGFGDKSRGECRAGELSAIRTVAMSEHQQSTMYLVLDRTTVTTALDHVLIFSVIFPVIFPVISFDTS